MELEVGNWTNSTKNHTMPDRFTFILYQLTVPVLFGVVTLSGLVGNGLVIYVIMSRERMQTVTNLLLLNLAVADLAFVLVVPPFTAYQMAAEWWPFGDVACRLLHYLVNVTAYVTVYTLVAVAVMRYMTVVHAALTARYRTPRVTAAVIAGIWIAVLLLNVPVIASYHAGPYGTAALPDCDINNKEVGRYLFATFFAFGYAVPLSIIGAFSVRVFVDIRRQRACASAGVRRTKSFRRKQAVGRLLVLVVALFAILWLPVHIHLLVAYFGRISTERWYLAVSVIWQCLAYSNSCVNPIIYNHTSKDFRDAFRYAFSSSSRRRSESNRHLEGDAAEGSICAVSRPHLGQQRSMKEIAVASDTGVAQANLDKLQQQQQQQQPNPADDVDSLSDCSNAVHLED